MPPVTFDPWREDDLHRFLRTWARLSDTHQRVTGVEVRDALHIDDDAALAAQSHLRKLELLEASRGTRRFGVGPLQTAYSLTRAGTLAALHGELPSA